MTKQQLWPPPCLCWAAKTEMKFWWHCDEGYAPAKSSIMQGLAQRQRKPQGSLCLCSSLKTFSIIVMVVFNLFKIQTRAIKVQVLEWHLGGRTTVSWLQQSKCLKLFKYLFLKPTYGGGFFSCRTAPDLTWPMLIGNVSKPG